MIEPAQALRTAVRAALIAFPALTALVPAERIRSGTTRPDNAACIVLAGDQVQYLGRASGGFHLARVWIDAHVWAIEDGAEMAQSIAAALATALRDAPASDEIALDAWEPLAIRFMRDPAPERAWTHGVAEIEAVVRWRA